MLSVKLSKCAAASMSIFPSVTVILCSVLQKSISSTFYKQLLHQYSLEKKLQSQTIIIEKLCKALLYEKGKCKMLMKWTPEACLKTDRVFAADEVGEGVVVEV